MTNVRSTERSSRADLAECLNAFQMGQMFFSSEFPSNDSDFQVISEKFLSHCAGNFENCLVFEIESTIIIVHYNDTFIISAVLVPYIARIVSLKNLFINSYHGHTLICKSGCHEYITTSLMRAQAT